ncbi:NUDIX hydrolase [Candidatus Saccharibacteria bacterium]|nr:MAG: NUDIX hydrolase [Candidatus Saccharibacteria bacterium]
MGENFEDAAKRGLKEQTNLDVSVSFCGFYRQRDYAEDSKELLEDKLFIIFQADSKDKTQKIGPMLTHSG